MILSGFPGSIKCTNSRVKQTNVSLSTFGHIKKLNTVVSFLYDASSLGF